MPQKKQPDLKGKAAEKKKKEFVEDKTFGMKNKNKSKKVQQYVQQVHRQAQQIVTGGGGRGGGGGGGGDKGISKKALMEARAAELAMYYRPVGEAGGGGGDAAAKDVRKSTKIDLYVDQRDQRGSSDDPSAAVSQTLPQQQQLDATIRERHGKPRGSQAVTSQVVCRHFLDAVELGKYGWFWVCPNGGDQCPHRHALPPGFVVKSKAEQEMERSAATAAQEAALVSVEDEIERERAKLTTSTPVTLEAFLAWKERKRKEREQAERRRRDAALKKSAGSGGGGGAAHRVALAYGLSGRDLFQYRPELFVDDTDADASKYGERFYEENGDAENGEEEETLRRRTEQALQVDEAAEEQANVSVGDASLFT
ncbi:hypothetical protein CDCA_CDCA11G3106 [Cyanidium caldarium]|uniref:C3H1-type domain-containing protein n=1 Tax=Cyanidium caldarium TaxID=2771 RepID=A0AAV9IY60_CYACA|nr:hypothetical protein CDCA_CDCA11G3106 [Cyanidium caldarium]